MTEGDALARAAALFKALGSESRLRLVRLLISTPKGVSELVSASEMSQPLVSQHLRTLRAAGIVSSRKVGREVLYELADHHITHIVEDTALHVAEPHRKETP